MPRHSPSLADTGIGKRNISNERNPLLAARQEFEESLRHEDLRGVDMVAPPKKLGESPLRRC